MTCSVRKTMISALTAIVLLPTLASAQTMTRASIEAAGVAVAQASAPDTLAEWQRQYDAARQKKDHGKVIRLLGLPTMIAGAALLGHGSICTYSSVTRSYSSCGSDAARGLGYVAFFGGIGMGVWGEMEFKDGDHEMTRLAMMKPSSKSGFDLALGPTTSIGYHFVW